MSQLHMVSEAEKLNNLLLCLCFHSQHRGVLQGAACSASIGLHPAPKNAIGGGGGPALGVVVWLERESCAWNTATVYLNICVCMCGLHIAESKCDACSLPTPAGQTIRSGDACQVCDASCSRK